jgi:hypothetical protein
MPARTPARLAVECETPRNSATLPMRSGRSDSANRSRRRTSCGSTPCRRAMVRTRVLTRPAATRSRLATIATSPGSRVGRGQRSSWAGRRIGTERTPRRAGGRIGWARKSSGMRCRVSPACDTRTRARVFHCFAFRARERSARSGADACRVARSVQMNGTRNSQKEVRARSGRRRRRSDQASGAVSTRSAPRRRASSNALPAWATSSAAPSACVG